MERYLLIVNPYAAGGQARHLWEQHQAALQQALGDPLVAVTGAPEEVPAAIQAAVAQGVRRVVAMGGDGTNHALVNTMMGHNQAHPDQPLIYGMIPSGTGRDWARSMRLPLSVTRAASHIAAAAPRPVDVGLVEIDGEARYFLNISSAGISSDVVRRVALAGRRYPWTFLRAVITSLLHYQPEPVQVSVDGQPWYDGDAYIVAVANGQMFGSGIRIAPHAQPDDGLLDVVLVEGMSRSAVLRALYRAYLGTHLSHPKVHFTRGRHVEVTSDGRLLGMDLDGEPAAGRRLVYTIRPAALKMLV